MTTLNLNRNDYVVFQHRNYARRGDMSTWAKFNRATNKLTVNKAARGLISDAYWAEMFEFCASYGIDFEAMPFGSRESVIIG